MHVNGVFVDIYEEPSKFLYENKNCTTYTNQLEEYKNCTTYINQLNEHKNAMTYTN